MYDDYENTSASGASQEPSYTQGGALMKCPHCKADIEVGSMYCEFCGSKLDDSYSPAHAYSPPPTYSNVSPVSPQANVTQAPSAVKSMVFSIVGLVVMFLMLVIASEVDEDMDVLIGMFAMGGVAASVVGMVLGIVGLKRVGDNRSAYSGVPMLKVGKILGIVGVAIWGVFMLLGIIVTMEEEGIGGLLY